jgi:hypothetical protein
VITLVKKNIGELFKNIELQNTIEDFEFVLKFGQAGIEPRGRKFLQTRTNEI